MTAAAVEVTDLRHRYGEREALRGVTFRVARGALFGLLGPNGGGKSTLFRILTTLLPATSGTARILGHDVVTEAPAVRRRIGVVFQHPSVDGLLGVEENLVHHGRLHGLGGSRLRERVDVLLERFGLADRRRDRVGTLSGGLVRRVELAKGLLHEPELLLLDEPSTGLDPGARRDLMAELQLLRDRDGVTVVLATHYMEEAERCDRVAILDAGRLVALDAPAVLRARVGGDVVVVQTADPEALRGEVVRRFGLEGAVVDGALRLEHPRGHELVRDVVEAFPDRVRAVTFGKPTLEDVFVHLTGHRFVARESA